MMEKKIMNFNTKKINQNNKQEAIDEYDICFIDAQKKEEYVFNNNTKSNINELKKMIKRNTGNEIDMRGAFVLILGNISIEVNILSVDGEFQLPIKDGKKYLMEYCFLFKYFDENLKKELWCEAEFLENKISIDDLDIIEKKMFDLMIFYAKKHNYTWMELND